MNNGVFLVTTATSFEMAPFLAAAKELGLDAPAHLVCGIGPVESALRLTHFLASASPKPKMVLNLGVAGAYQRPGAAAVLDLCLAKSEALGDFGVSDDETVRPLRGDGLEVHDAFPLDLSWVEAAQRLLSQLNFACIAGDFITVNAASATAKQGSRILKRYPQALCENMEGAALARVCDFFGLGLVELRCISNCVDDPGRQQWKLKAACARCGEAGAQLIAGLQHE